MEKKYVIGIDSGTSRIKAVLFDLKGQELFQHGIANRGFCKHEDWYEEDMNELWESAKICIKSVTANVNKEEIIGIGITAQGDGLWMIDEHGEPVRPGMCFCDGRTSQIINEWRQNGRLKDAFDICKTAVFGSSMSAEIKWMERYEKDVLDKAKVFFHLKDWFFYKLTGEITCDVSDMSIPMLNAETRKYDERLFEIFDIEEYRDNFPQVKETSDNKAYVSKELLDELNLCEDTLVTGGPMDIIACALSCGAINNGQAMSILGTAAIHSVIMDYPDENPYLAGMTIAHCKEDRWIKLVSSLCGTPNLEWFLNNLGGNLKNEAKEKGKNIYDYCEEVISNIPIGSNGVVYHPYLLAGGERAPFFKSNIKASFDGISVSNTVRDLLRSVYEGVAMAMVDCYSSVSVPINEIFVTGGGAKSDVWMQMLADATAKEIVICEGSEHGARGAAMVCAVAAGIYDTYESVVENVTVVKKRYIPNAEKHKTYMKLYKLYKSGYEIFFPWWDERSNFLNSVETN